MYNLLIEIKVDESKCVGCGNCTAVCPLNNTLAMRIVSGKLKSGFLCEGCGLCIRVCPFKALELVVKETFREEDIKEKEVEVVSEEPEVAKPKETNIEEQKEEIKRFPDYISEWFSTGLIRRMFESDSEIDFFEIIKKFEKAGDCFSILYLEVIGKKLCSLCGACVSACSEDVLKITVDGRLSYPHLVDECKNCASCLLKCPKTDYYKLNESEDELGDFLEILSLQKTGGNSKNAGAITTLLKYAMEKEIIDCAIVVGENPVLVTKKDKLDKYSGIKFVVAPTLSLLKEAIKRGYKKIAIVGVPCQVKAARKMKELGFEEIKLIMGVFCPRGKHPEKEAIACRVCKDMTAEFSDISFGNTGSQRGWRTVIVRSGLGKKIVDGAIKEGLIRVGKVDVNKLRSLALKKKGGCNE